MSSLLFTVSYLSNTEAEARVPAYRDHTVDVAYNPAG